MWLHLSIFLLIFTASLAENEDFYAGCGVEKGCFGMPNDCIGSQNCQVAFSYLQLSEELYQFQMLGNDIKPEEYIAIGLSEDQHMLNDAVIVCTSAAMPEVQAYWNFYYYSLLLQDPKANIENDLISYKDGQIFCSFDYKAKAEIHQPPPANNDISLNLDDEAFYLFLAKGPMVDGKINLHETKTMSSDPVSLFLKSSKKIAMDKTFERSDYNSYLSDSDFDACGDTKGCFGLKEGCIESKNCDTWMSYVGTDANTYHFELYTKEKSYVSTAFNKEKSMGPAPAIVCAKQPKGSSIPEVAMYFNKGYSTPELQSDASLGISNSKISETDGKFTCSFDLQAELDLVNPNNATDVYYHLSLNNEAYHLLLAIGTAEEDGTISKHSDKLASSETYDLSDYNSHIFDPALIYDKCGDEKGCFGFTNDCLASKSCKMVVTYSANNMDKYSFEMQGLLENGEGYVATGINQGSGMGKALAVVCQVESNGFPHVAMFWNPINQASALLKNSTFAISNSKSTLNDGVLNCKFDLLSTLSITNPSDENDTLTFELNSNPYHLLLAKGPVSSNTIKYHKSKLCSKDTFQLFDFNFASVVDIYSGCSGTKGCFGSEEGCLASKNCSMVTRFYGTSKDSYSVEVYGSLKQGNEYIASGLSFDKIMGNDSVMACVLSETGQPMGEMYWNIHGNSLPLEDANQGIKNFSGKYVNNQLYCHFEMEANLNIDIPDSNGESMLFDMNAMPFYLMMATGPMKNAVIVKHVQEAVSNETYKFSDYNAYFDDAYEGCGKTKGCFGLPSNCIDSRNCIILSTYAQQDSGDVEFSLRLSQSTSSSYVAVALSNDDKMGDASVMFCYPPSGQNNGVAMAWNFDRTSVVLASPEEGLSSMKSQFTDGVLSCSFVRTKLTQISLPGTDDLKSFDLSQKYFLLLGYGPISIDDESRDLGVTLQHHLDKAASDTSIDFSDFKVVAASGAILIKVTYFEKFTSLCLNSKTLTLYLGSWKLDDCSLVPICSSWYTYCSLWKNHP